MLRLLIDKKGKKYLIKVQPDGKTHLHLGVVDHNEILKGKHIVETSKGEKLLVITPSLEDYVLKMPRRAQIIYPKDAARIVSLLDLSPGKKVLEAGTGSGSLTLFLGRAVAPSGLIISYEIREDHYETAVKNIDKWHEKYPIQLRLGDIREVKEREYFDALMLDMVAPWDVLKDVLPAIKAGGRIVCYLPNIPQVMNTVNTLKSLGIGQIEVFEVLERPWDIVPTKNIARPRLRMVAHTAFLVSAINIQRTE